MLFRQVQGSISLLLYNEFKLCSTWLRLAGCRSGARLLSRLLSSVLPVHHPAAVLLSDEPPGSRASPCCWRLESYEVVDDDVERAILRLSWDGCHYNVTPSLWVT